VRGVRALATITPQRGQAASVTAFWPQRGQSMGGFMGANGNSGDEAPSMSPRTVEATAPTRIDLAGGTLDIWPLYLFHHGAQTINAAISLRAWCEIRPRPDRRLVIVSDDAGQRVEVDHWSQLRDTHDLKLLGRLLHYFQAEGLELRTRSESPVGA